MDYSELNIQYIKGVGEKRAALFNKLGINTVNEYEMPPMLGWTAGTYLYLIEICKKYLNGGTGNE